MIRWTSRLLTEGGKKFGSPGPNGLKLHGTKFVTCDLTSSRKSYTEEDGVLTESVVLQYNRIPCLWYRYRTTDAAGYKSVDSNLQDENKLTTSETFLHFPHCGAK